MPRPHVAEQCVHSDHGDQLSSAESLAEQKAGDIRERETQRQKRRYSSVTASDLQTDSQATMRRYRLKSQDNSNEKWAGVKRARR